MRCMNLEPVIQSEVSQGKMLCINAYIYEFRKMVLVNLFAGQE